ncbi:MAG: hypothetical protein FWD35_01485 [Oscillospiraceae bacterium]|nr:hypothetical protein [Oscillospiraceae bacterium]
MRGENIIKRKKAQIILIAVCALLTLTAVFLAVLGIMFAGSGGRNATEFFGRNLFLVRESGFELIPAPSLIIGERVEFDELAPGHIIMYRLHNDDGGSRIVLMQIPESGFAVPQEDIVAKAVQTSRFFGYVLVFATSPAGGFTIAVLPCLVLILLELFLKPLLRRLKPAGVAPVNKQNETPTFVPLAEKPKVKSEAVLQAYKDIANLSENQEDTPQLFTSPETPPLSEPPPSSTPPVISSGKKKPLSSEKLAEAIANMEQSKSKIKENNNEDNP